MDPHCYTLGDPQLHHSPFASIAQWRRTSCYLHYAWLFLNKPPNSVGAQMPCSTKLGWSVMLVSRYGSVKRIQTSARPTGAVAFFMIQVAHA